MKLNIFNQILHNWEKGYFSVVKDKNGWYRLFTFYNGWDFSVSAPNRKGVPPEIKYLNGDTWTEVEIGEYSQKEDWKIVDTIHPSELMGSGLKKGDKVKIKKGVNGIIDSIKEDVYYVKDKNGTVWFCRPEEISLLKEERELELNDDLLTVTVKENGEKILKVAPDGTFSTYDKDGKLSVTIKPNEEKELSLQEVADMNIPELEKELEELKEELDSGMSTTERMAQKELRRLKLSDELIKKYRPLVEEGQF